MKKVHLRLAAEILGALVVIGCGSSEPTRSDPPGLGVTEHADEDASPPAEKKAVKRVVGYLQAFHMLKAKDINLAALTHLTITFAGPLDADQKGSRIDFYEGDNGATKELVKAAHQESPPVMVLGALAGGDTKRAKKLTANFESDPKGFVISVKNFVKEYELDGIDIDIENEAIVPDQYEALVNALAPTLKQDGKLLTAAVGNGNRENYRALDKMNFISVMSYDKCGDWSEQSCQHSTYSDAVDNLKFWSSEYWQTRGIKYDKANVLLGVPFYGYCWGSGCSGFPSTLTNTKPDRSVVTYQLALSHWQGTGSPKPVPDEITDPDKDYYVSLNGPETIAKKALLARDYGGVMIWELGHDAAEPNSLLSVIQNTPPR